MISMIGVSSTQSFRFVKKEKYLLETITNMKINNNNKKKKLKKEFSIQNFLMKCKENFVMIVLQLLLPAMLIEYALYHK